MTRPRLIDDWGPTGLGLIVFGGGGIAVLMVVVCAAIIFGGRAVGRTTCANWSQETGVPTKFVILNWADSGTCLARTPDGRWVLNSRWTAFVRGDKEPK